MVIIFIYIINIRCLFLVLGHNIIVPNTDGHLFTYIHPACMVMTIEAIY